MGGRGQNYTIVNRLPNYNKAVIQRHKMTDYLLNPDGNETKAVFFRDLGYNMSNWERFASDVRNKLKTNKALKYEKDEYGNVSYQVNMVLGINKKRMVATAWIIKKGENYPRFVTAYPNHKLKRKD